MTSTVTSTSQILDIPGHEGKLEFIQLGGGREVGRSCHVIKFRDHTIMLDCGMHPGLRSLGALPLFDNIDIEDVDMLLLTHFHLDHLAGLPYVTEKTLFKGRVFATLPTRDIMPLILNDFVRVRNDESNVYSENDIVESHKKIEVVTVHREMVIGDVRITPYNAGHVLGAAMYLISIAGVNILYTGDYSMEESRHLLAADFPGGSRVDVLICESTFGDRLDEKRDLKEVRFTAAVQEVVNHGGHCLIPVHAIADAQEISLLLDAYWKQHPELQHIKIFYISTMAQKTLEVYRRYVWMMTQNFKNQHLTRGNPFEFKYIKNAKSTQPILDSPDPCVVITVPGNLQAGRSRELFEKWAPDPKNGIVFCGYAETNTLARELYEGKVGALFKGLNGRNIEKKLSMDRVSFTVHVDFSQNSEFILRVNAPNLILVHGEHTGMQKLCKEMDKRFKALNKVVRIYTPENGDIINLQFEGQKGCQIIGPIATGPTGTGSLVSGLLVMKNYRYSIMSPEDAPGLTGLKTDVVKHKLRIPYTGSYELLKIQLELTGEVQPTDDMDDIGMPRLRIFSVIDLSYDKGNGEVLLEWNSDPVTDIHADAVIGYVMKAESHPLSIIATHQAHDHHHDMPEASVPGFVDTLQQLLGNTVGHENVQYDQDKQQMLVDFDTGMGDFVPATVDLTSKTVECSDGSVARNLAGILDRAACLFDPTYTVLH